MKSVKTIIVRHSFSLTVLCSLMLAGCGLVTPTNQPTPALVSPSLPPSPIPQSTTTATPAPTEEIYPTFTAAPTLTAIATLQAGQSITLANIYMNDEQSGWGIDVSDHIVHTDDGGHAWKDVTPPSGAYRDAGFFALDADTAWATSYQKDSPEPNNASVWRTYVGGASWEELSMNLDGAPSYYEPVDLRFMDTQTGELLILISGEQNRYVLYGTTDAGTHWTLVNSHFNMRISPTPENWSIFQSTDAGLARQMILLPAPNPLPESFAENQYFCDAERINRNPPHTWQVTIQCTVYTPPVSSSYEYYFYSLDSGQTWVSWPPTGDVEFINSLNGWRMALSNGSSYQIEKTQDGGLTWEKIKAVQWEGDLDFVTQEVGWAIARQGDAVALVSTIDGGRTWQEIKPVIELPTTDSLSTELPEPTPDPAAILFDNSSWFQMTSETVGWATVSLPDSWTQRILHTTDSGLNWQDVSPYIMHTTNVVDEFLALDDAHAWVLTQTDGSVSDYVMGVWVTKDGGRTWKQSIVPYSARPVGAYMTFDDPLHGLVEVVKDQGAGTGFILPYKTSDGGLSWQELPLEEVSRADIKPPDDLSRMPDGTEMNTNVCVDYDQSQTFFSKLEGIFQVRCADYLFISQTHNGGQTWDTPSYRRYLLYTSLVDFVDMNNGWYRAQEDTGRIPLEESLTNTVGAALYVTHDGGKTSSEIIPIISIVGAQYDIRDLLIDSPADALGYLDFIDLKTGFATTNRPPLEYSVILKTTDGGYTWNGWVPHLRPVR